MPDYHVVVHNIPGYTTLDVGTVSAPNHSEARLAALSKYGEEGLRPKTYTDERPLKALYEDDDFDARMYLA